MARFIPILAALCGQAFFTAGDILARANMRVLGFHWMSFPRWWFVAYWAVRAVATMLQLYVLANFQLGRSSAVFACSSIIMANAFSILLLKEAMPPQAYAGVALAILAILVIAWK